MAECTSNVVTEAPAAKGIYVYCMIETTDPRTFGTIGIGGRGDDYTLHYRDQISKVAQSYHR